MKSIKSNIFDVDLKLLRWDQIHIDVRTQFYREYMRRTACEFEKSLGTKTSLIADKIFYFQKKYIKLLIYS